MTNFNLLIIVLNFISIFWHNAKAEEDSFNKNEKIRRDLMKNYDKHALPQREVNDTTTVSVAMRPRSFFLDDDRQVFTVNSWMVLYWQDKRLKWDYKDYGGLKMAHFGDDELWKPDLHVYNNAEVSEVDHYGNIHFLVHSNGIVLWVPPASLKTPCPMDLQFWPFDEHTCFIVMGSWTTHGWQISFNLYKNTTKISTSSLLKHSGSWNLLEATQAVAVTKYPSVPEPYITLQFKFKLKRNSPTFTAVAVVPAVVIPMLLLTQFILPVDHPKRLSIGFVCSVLVFLEILFLKISLPKLGTSVPLIVSYYSQCFIMVVLTVALSAILGRLAHSQNPLLAFPPPELLKRVLTGPVSFFLCLQSHASKVGLSGKMAEDGEVLDEGKAPNYSHEWLLVAKVVDRIAFIAFVCAFVFSLIAYVSRIK